MKVLEISPLLLGLIFQAAQLGEAVLRASDQKWVSLQILVSPVLEGETMAFAIYQEGKAMAFATYQEGEAMAFAVDQEGKMNKNESI